MYNKNDDEIDFEVKKDLFDNVKLIGKDDDNLKKDLIEKKMSLGLLIKTTHLKLLTKNTKFLKIPVFLPKIHLKVIHSFIEHNRQY